MKHGEMKMKSSSLVINNSRMLSIIACLLLINLDGCVMPRTKNSSNTSSIGQVNQRSDCLAVIPSAVKLPKNTSIDINWIGTCGKGKAQGVGVLEIQADNFIKMEGKMVDGDFVGEVKYTSYQYKGAFMGTGGSFTNDPSVKRLPEIAEGELEIDNHKGLLIDKSAGLVWRRCAVGRTWNSKSQQCTGVSKRGSWNKAVQIANGFKDAGYTDWRLPSAEEFKRLIMNDGANCEQLREKSNKLFGNFDHTREMFSDAHWIADNSSDLQNPKNAQLSIPMEWMPGRCGFIYSDQRLHAELPVIVVRGGDVSSAWKNATSKLKGVNEKVLETKSRKGGEKYWNGVNKKLNDLMTPSSSTPSQAEEIYSCKIVCRTEGFLAYDTRDLGLLTIKAYPGLVYNKMRDICHQLPGGWYPANSDNDCKKQ